MRPLTRRERVLFSVLLALVVVVSAGLASIRLFGARTGERCRDSYSCRGFLFGGSECLSLGDRSYCTLYCRTDAVCPHGWHCLGAHPTVMRVETNAVDRVCIRDADR